MPTRSPGPGLPPSRGRLARVAQLLVESLHGSLEEAPHVEAEPLTDEARSDKNECHPWAGKDEQRNPDERNQRTPRDLNETRS